jgi:hypothetical protein
MGTIFTNKYNLPQSFVNAVKVDNHVTRGDISVTTLIDAPRIRQLKRKHQIVEDVSDRVFALMGTAVHHVLELSDIGSSSARKIVETAGILKELGIRNGDTGMVNASVYLEKVARLNFPEAFNNNIITEATLSVQAGDMILSGTFDRLDKEQLFLQDYKNCSTWMYIYPEERKKWARQQNIYRWMIWKEYGILVDKLQIVAIFRDWSSGKAKREGNYPKAPVMVIDLDVYPIEKVEKYILNRVNLHASADTGADIDCTGEERWASATEYAVKSPGKKRAERKFEDKGMAEAYILKNKFSNPKLFIEERIGASRRCAEYCPVRDFCPQFKKEIESNQNIEE